MKHQGKADIQDSAVVREQRPTADTATQTGRYRTGNNVIPEEDSCEHNHAQPHTCTAVSCYQHSTRADSSPQLYGAAAGPDAHR